MSAMVLSPAPRTTALTPARTQRRAAADARVVPTAGGREPRPAALRLTLRGRLVLLLLALALGVGAVLFASQASADGTVSAQEVQRHVVAPGETLWRIAAGITPPGHDVRDTVDRLVRLNHLPSAGLMAGQIIVVPVG
ncbi:LysM peptidoglycan-binding domain-containing protein [Cellulomonas alba]|uniref:LysM peptidoglycan-binding domain-containing protein n=1 Tax=Cellulomonas alba TaxID=3053467 RepID=A0ABT7SJ09_9CELL|nr:LysM peptidoglycan-binding domain-containing protein [Cellulomonas alba]MDM7856168.1 LysM peptidoglycan-binding domain-containing protein [Cellulomonas alba]